MAHIADPKHKARGKESDIVWGQFWQQIDSLNVELAEKWEVKRAGEEKMKSLKRDKRKARRVFGPDGSKNEELLKKIASKNIIEELSTNADTTLGLSKLNLMPLKL